jgi:hypothetical protein
VRARYTLVLYPLVCASFIGGCTLSALTLAPLVWSRRYIFVALLLEGVATAVGWIVLGPHLRQHHTAIVLQRQGWSVGPQLALFIAAGVSVLGLAAVDFWTRRNAESLLLGLWVFGTFVFTAFLNWTINARSVLPLIPAAGILLARRLDGLGIASRKALQWKAATALLLSGAVSLWVAQADAEWANVAKQTAPVIGQRAKTETGTVWFQGHWGFQYYMQRLGMRPLDFTNSTLNPQDLLVVPESDFYAHAPPGGFVASEELMETRLRQPVMTMNSGTEAGFYGSFYGALPFAFGKAPTEQYRLFRIGATMRPDQWQLPEP